MIVLTIFVVTITTFFTLYAFKDMQQQLAEESQEVIESQKQTEEKTVESEEIEQQEPVLTQIQSVVLLEDTYFVLDDSGNVWTWKEDQTKANATQVEAIENVVKMVDAGGAVYALTEAGEVYAWGSNKYLMIEPDKQRDKVYDYPIQLESLSGIVDIDAGNGNGFAVDEEGKLLVWGLDIYPFWEQDKMPGIPEESAELFENVDKIYMGAESYHYFRRQDGAIFSIMDLEHNLDNLKYLILPSVQEKELATPWWEDADLIDIREGGKYGYTFLYEVRESLNEDMLSADEYTMYLYQKDKTLWYWNSDRITYHDKELAGALVETAALNYSGNFEQVNIREVLASEDANAEIPDIIAICSGKENVLFLLENGQVFLSEYVTKEIKDVEYYDTGNTNPYRISETCIASQMHLKELSFRKLDYTDIVSVSSNKDRDFFLADKDGNIYHYVTETEE